MRWARSQDNFDIIFLVFSRTKKNSKARRLDRILSSYYQVSKDNRKEDFTFSPSGEIYDMEFYLF